MGPTRSLCGASRQAGCDFSVRPVQREEAGIQCFAGPAQRTDVHKTPAAWPPLFAAQKAKYEHASPLPLSSAPQPHSPTATPVSPANVNSTISAPPGAGLAPGCCSVCLLSCVLRGEVGIGCFCPVKVCSWARQAAHNQVGKSFLFACIVLFLRDPACMLKAYYVPRTGI